MTGVHLNGDAWTVVAFLIAAVVVLAIRRLK